MTHQLSDDARTALLDAGSGIADENPGFWHEVAPVLRAVAAAESVTESEDVVVLLASVRCFADANDPNFEQPSGEWFQVSVYDLDYHDPAAVLAELRAVTIETDRDAAAFLLEYVWPW